MPDGLLLAEVIAWLELRAHHRIGGARFEAMAELDLLRSGDWLQELSDLRAAAGALDDAEYGRTK